MRNIFLIPLLQRHRQSMSRDWIYYVSGRVSLLRRASSATSISVRPSKVCGKPLLISRIAYVNWSVFTALTTTLFYFSVWELALTGSELSLLATVSPIILGVPFLLDVFSTRTGRTVLHVLTLLGLAAYLTESPVYRLLVVAFASSTMAIGLAVDWSVPPATIGYQGMGMSA